MNTASPLSATALPPQSAVGPPGESAKPSRVRRLKFWGLLGAIALVA